MRIIRTIHQTTARALGASLTSLAPRCFEPTIDQHQRLEARAARQALVEVLEDLRRDAGQIFHTGVFLESDAGLFT
jgi:hypothetical protein